MAKQSILDQYEIGATAAFSGNVAELTLAPDKKSYKVRDQNNQGIKYQEQRLRIQLNSGGYLTCWFIVPPFFETLRQPVDFNGEVQEYRGTRFLVACKMDGSSPAMRQPAPVTPPSPQQAPPESPKPDWDAIAEGKVRTLLVGAAIESGQIKIAGVLDLGYWVGYCMTGRAPLPPSKIPEPDKSITEPPNDDIPY